MKKIYLMIFVFVLFLLAGCGSKVNIEFVTNGGTPVDAITKEADFDLNKLPTTTKEGYEFGGWFLNEECTISLGKEQPKNLEFKLYALWIPIKYDYKVEYYNEKLDGGYQLVYGYNLKGNFNEVVNAEIIDFLGFTFNESKSNKTTTIKTTGNETLKIYYDRNLYKVSIDEDGGTPVEDLTFKYGETIVLPTVTKTGYQFASWDNNPIIMPANDITVKAIWEPLEVNYKVEIYEENADDDGYTLVNAETKKALSGSTVEYDPVHSIPQEFILSTNHPNSKLEDIVNGDGSTVLKVYYKRRMINVEFNFYEGKEAVIKQYKYGASNYLINPGERTGHEFLFWSDTTSASTPTTVPFIGLENFKIFANWKKLSYTISFETNATIAVTSITALYDSVITAPTNPVRQGYNFLGWFKDQSFTEQYVFNKMEANNITLYAKWEGLPYTIEFVSNGGSEVAPITALIDSDIAKPVSTRDGYELVNWYTDSNLTQVFTTWKMPYNGIKLYAKWVEVTYTITFNTNGGSPINDIVGKYLDQISAPANNPTKPGFIFDGYYINQEFTEEFVFDYMPVGGATIYVKWIDETLATSIANVLRQDIGSVVNVRGYVYGILDSAYYGYFLYDDTGYIYIHAPLNDIQIGDFVSVSGNLSNDARLTNISEVIIESSDNLLKNPVNVSLSGLYNLEDKLSNYYKYFNITGILEEADGKYVLFDYFNEYEILIDNRSVDYALLNQFVNKFVAIDFAYDYINHRITVIEIEEIVDNQARFDFLKSLIILKYDNSHYEALASFAFPTTDNFGMGATLTYTATGTNASYYDTVNKKFNEVDGNVSVTFSLELSVGSIQEVFEINIIVGDVEIITISELYDKLPYASYCLDVVVIIVFDYDGYTAVVRDETGYLFAQDLRGVHVGDHLIIEAYKYVYEDYEYIDSKVIEVIEQEVDLNLNPTVLTPIEFNNQATTLDLGEYVELTGYIELEEEQYYNSFKFVCGDNEYPIITFDYMEDSPLQNYFGYLVNFRTYVLNSQEDTFLLYGGIRGDIQYPEYDDAEAVNAIQSVFTRLYSDKSFYPFEELYLPSKDLVYGVNIAYEFSEASLPYYVEGRFINVEESVNISINFTLTKNAITQNFTYNTILEPFPITSSSDLYNIEDYETVYVKGLVVYRHPEYVILKDDFGYIRYDAYDVPVYLGDLVILKGYKYIYNEEVCICEEDYPIVISIISRGNEVGINSEIMSVANIYDISFDDGYSLSKFVTLAGELNKEANWYYITDGINKVRLEPVDDYSWYKLESSIGKYITVNCFLGYYQYNNWYVYYLGNNIEVIELTDLEKIAKIKEFIQNKYNGIDEDEDSYLPLEKSFPTLNGNVVYSSSSPALTFADGNIYTNIVDVITVATITATITVGELVEAINFDVNIIPYENVNPIEVEAITNIFNQDNGTEVRIVGYVLADFYTNSVTNYLVKDETGVIYVELPAGSYNYYSHVGRCVDIIGIKAEEQGRVYIKASTYTNTGSSFMTQVFEPMTFAQIYNLNQYDHTNIGRPIEVTGKIINSMYITDGFTTYGILSGLYNGSNISQYEGCNITVRGFYFGYPTNGDNLIMFVYTNYVGYEPVIALANNTDQDKVDKGVYDLYAELGYINYAKFNPVTTVSLPSLNERFPDCIYTYSVLGDTGAYIDNNILYFVDLHREYEVTIRVNITSGSVSETVDLTFRVVGYELNTLDDLFLNEPGTKEINLIGKVILVSREFIYFLINGDVYYLEQVGYSYELSEGDVCLIQGQKSIIDGEVNYSYSIKVEQLEVVNEDVYNVISKTVSEFYTDTALGVDLRRGAYIVSGIIRYDENSELFYIEDENNRIYIRDLKDKLMPTSLKMSSYFELPEYVDEVVDCVVLFPNRYVYDDYILVDLASLNIQELTLEEDLDHAIIDLQSKFEDMVFYSNDQFLEYFCPKYLHSVNTVIALKDPIDSKYFIDSLYQVGIVEEEAFVTFVVTLSNDTISKDFELVVHLMPMELSTIKDVLYGVTYDSYLIEGIVQAYHKDSFIIIKDATGTIYVELRLGYELDLTINVGDKLKVLGERDYYGYSDITPIIKCYGILKQTGTGNTVNNVPVEYDTADILDIDYSVPGEYVKYISFTGVIVFTGNIDYPSYGIIGVGSNSNYKIELIGQTYTPFHDMMNNLLGTTITINGWLVLNSAYTRFSWDMIYDTHIVVS